MGGHGRDTKTGSLSETGVGGQWYGTFCRLDCVFGGRTEGTANLGLVEPDPFAKAGGGHARANTIDDTSAVLMRNDSGECQGLGQPLPPFPV